MKNPITSCSLFATPESVESLSQYAESFTGDQKQVALVILGMTWNLASKLVDEQLEADNQIKSLKANCLNCQFWDEASAILKSWGVCSECGKPGGLMIADDEVALETHAQFSCNCHCFPTEPQESEQNEAN